jgi:hypothetical protein
MPSALASLQSKIRLSPGEQKVIKLLPPSGKRITTGELAKLYYAERQEPFHSRLIIVGIVRNLQRKIASVKSPPLYVQCTERAGPHQMQVWRTRK